MKEIMYSILWAALMCIYWSNNNIKNIPDLGKTFYTTWDMWCT